MGSSSAPSLLEAHTTATRTGLYVCVFGCKHNSVQHMKQYGTSWNLKLTESSRTRHTFACTGVFWWAINKVIWTVLRTSCILGTVLRRDRCDPGSSVILTASGLMALPLPVPALHETTKWFRSQQQFINSQVPHKGKHFYTLNSKELRRSESDKAVCWLFLGVFLLSMHRGNAWIQCCCPLSGTPDENIMLRP